MFLICDVHYEKKTRKTFDAFLVVAKSARRSGILSCFCQHRAYMNDTLGTPTTWVSFVFFHALNVNYRIYKNINFCVRIEKRRMRMEKPIEMHFQCQFPVDATMMSWTSNIFYELEVVLVQCAFTQLTKIFIFHWITEIAICYPSFYYLHHALCTPCFILYTPCFSQHCTTLHTVICRETLCKENIKF